MGLRTRLLATYALVILALLGLFEIAGRAWLRENLEAQMLDDLRRSATLAAEVLPAETPDPADRRWDDLADRLGADLGDRVTFIREDGKVIGDSEVAFAELPALENHNTRPEVQDARATGDGHFRRFSATIHRDLFYVAHRAKNGMVVRVARSAEQVDAALAAARGSALMAAAVAALLGVILALGMSEALSRPVREITDSARAMAGGFSRRIDVHRRDELGTLAVALNDLASGLARTIDDVTAERNRLAAVLAGMVEGVLVVDGEGRISLANQSLRELFSLRGEVVGRTPIEAIRSEELHAAIEKIRAGGRPGARVIHVVGPPEKTVEVRFSILSPESGKPGAAAGLVAVFHDISELKRLEQVRRDFVANASHELKTPVAAILGASETLSSGALRDETAGPRFVDVIARNATRLAALVQDLLDLSRLESREGPETLKSVDPSDAMARASTPYREAAAAKRISLLVEETSAPPVRGEPGLLERALTNLVLNAVRYTPEGGKVVMRAREIPPSGEARRAVRFEVEDTGIGIPRSALPRIFERFYRVDPARSRELGGTGLGLSIVKHAVDAMGGQVGVESAVGQGSTFSITLDAWDEARTRGTE